MTGSLLEKAMSVWPFGAPSNQDDDTVEVDIWAPERGLIIRATLSKNNIITKVTSELDSHGIEPGPDEIIRFDLDCTDVDINESDLEKYHD